MSSVWEDFIDAAKFELKVHADAFQWEFFIEPAKLAVQEGRATLGQENLVKALKQIEAEQKVQRWLEEHEAEIKAFLDTLSKKLPPPKQDKK